MGREREDARVGGLERTREEGVLWDELGRGGELGVDAEELVDREAFEGVVDDVGLDMEVGVDATDLGSGENNVAVELDGEEGLHVGLVGEVELGVGADDNIGEAEGEKPAEPTSPRWLATKTLVSLSARKEGSAERTEKRVILREEGDARYLGE